MRTTRTLILCLLAVFAVGAVVASAASAAEGPFYRICKNVGAGNGKYTSGTCLTEGAPKEWEKVRLAAGETKEVKAKAAAAAPYKLKAGTDTVECTTQKLAAGATINGSTGPNGSTSKETIEYSACTVTGNGTGCKVKEPIVTVPVVNELGYANAKREGKILEAFRPESGEKFVKLEFPTASCSVKSTEVRGSAIGEVWSGGKAVEVTKEPAEAKVGEVNFPATAIEKIWVESSGALTEKEDTLEAFGVGATLTGRSEVTLVGEPVWGVYT